MRADLRAFGLADSVSLEREPWWALIRLALSSPGCVAMMQMQDVLGLGSEARMNNPGREGGQWRWQLERGALTPALARRLRDATAGVGPAAWRRLTRARGALSHVRGGGGPTGDPPYPARSLIHAELTAVFVAR